MSDTADVSEIDQSDGSTVESEDDDESSLDSVHLSWRMPPDESFSDWTIEILTTTTELAETEPEQKDVYHVHKCVLAVGRKKCRYFERLFQNPQFSESESRTSTIHLNSSAAAAFPSMLDYIYSPIRKLEINTENATALYFLGQYFENPPLRWQAVKFRQEDLSVTNIGSYYAQAKLFKQETFVGKIIKFCFENLEKITPDSDLIEVSDVEFWSKIVALTRGHEGSSQWFYNSKHLSRLLGNFISLHKDHFDATTFALFTDPACIVEIDESVAVALLQVEALLFPESKTCVNLSSLQRRCIEALARGWETIAARKLDLDLCGLNPILFRCTFKEALFSARRRLWMEKVKVQWRDKFDYKVDSRTLATRVLVSGAGSEEANGVYTARGSWCFNGLVFRKRMADENGGDVEIFLEGKNNDPSDILYWWICRNESENTSARWLYEQPMELENQFIPPCEGWECAHDGLLPAPTLTILWDDDFYKDT